MRPLSQTIKFAFGHVRRLLPYLSFCTLVSVLYFFGAFWPVDRVLIDTSFKLFQTPASGRLVLIDFDPRSLEELEVWPWPRSIHAETISKLINSGVVEIGYDVDFSSRTTPSEDQRLADVLSESKTAVILPAFRQRASTLDGPMMMKNTSPLRLFSEHVQTGSVMFRPAFDGLIRELELSMPAANGDLLAMSALLAGPAALKDQSFYVDYGIDIATVPRFSVIDLLQDRVPVSALLGKKVIVGAAATELGDQHAVPVYNRLFGIEVQALAFESMVQGRTLDAIGPTSLIIVLILMTVVIGSRLEPLRWQESSIIGGTMIVSLAIGGIVLQGLSSFIVPMTPVIVLIMCIVGYATYRDLWTLASLVFRQRMNLIHQGAFIREILDNSFDGVVVTDSEGIIVAHNQSAKRLLQATESSLIGTMFNEYLPDSEAAKITAPGLKETEQSLSQKEAIIAELVSDAGVGRFLEIQHGQFSRHVSKTNKSERRDIDRIFNTYTFRDVTVRVNREVLQQAEAQRVIDESRAKSEVMATMSHELRTPLNAILGFSEVMKMQTLGDIGKQYRSYADNIYTSGRHLLGLIDHILDVACIDTGRFSLDEQPFDVGRMLEQCVHMLAASDDGGAHDIRLNIGDDLKWMYGDERLIKQCVINLLSNSIHYTPSGGQINVIGRLDARRDFVIEVDDTGVGMDSTQLEHVRKPFYRVGGAKTSYAKGNVGLGLSLVDAYIRVHDGRLEISSQPGRGTTVRLILPNKRIVEAEPPEPATVESGGNVVGFKKPN